MKNKKAKLWKLLALSGTLGLVAVVPVITTACSTSNTDNGGSNNNGGDNNNGGNGDGTDKPAEKTEVKLNADIKADAPLTIIGSFSDLIQGAQAGVNKALLDGNLAKKINDSDELKGKLISNYNDVKENLGEITISSKGNDSPFGANTWETPNIVTYYVQNQQLYISSVSDLKSQLEKDNNAFLDEIMKNALAEDAANYETSFKLTANKALLVDSYKDTKGDYLRVNVTATKKAQNSENKGSRETNGQTTTPNNTVEMELRIPTSSVNYVPIETTVTIKSKDENKVTGITNVPTFVKYDIGIDATAHISAGTTSGGFEANGTEGAIKVDLAEANSSITEGKGGKVTAANLVKSLGWEKPATKEGETTPPATSDSVAEVNNEKVAQDLKIFNTDFSNLTVKPVDGSSFDSLSAGYTGQFIITIDAQPRQGFYWDDGTNDKKPITLEVNSKNGLLVTVQDGVYNSDESGKWHSNNVFTATSPELEGSKDKTGDDFINFWTDEKIVKLEAEINAKLKEVSPKNIGVEIDVTKGKTENKLTATVVESAGHKLKDSNVIKNQTWEFTLAK